MDIYEIINHRQSDRQYDPERPVEPEKIRRILEAARIAPSPLLPKDWVVAYSVGSTRKPCVNYCIFPIRNESFSTSYWDTPPNRFGRKNENLPTR